MIVSWLFGNNFLGKILAGSMIVIASWAIGNNFLRTILVRDVIILVISTGWLVIMIVSSAVRGNNLVYLEVLKDSAVVIYKIT